MQQPPSDSHISTGNTLGITVPELHSAPAFYPAGTRLIWISEAGEIDSIDRAEAATVSYTHLTLPTKVYV